MKPLLPRDLSLLAKMLGRLGSDQDGEVAAAGAAVTQFLRKRGLSWDEVLIPKAAAPPAPCPPTDAFGWRQRANSCLQRSELLSDLGDRIPQEHS